MFRLRSRLNGVVFFQPGAVCLGAQVCGHEREKRREIIADIPVFGFVELEPLGIPYLSLCGIPTFPTLSYLSLLGTLRNSK